MARRHAAFRLERSERAVPEARTACVRTAQGWGITDEAWLADLGLVVSELVGNAVRHAEGAMLVELAHGGDAVRVAVEDCSPRPPQPRRSAEEDEGGRGLSIVDALSASWGVIPSAGGKHVWADLALPPVRL